MIKILAALRGLAALGVLVLGALCGGGGAGDGDRTATPTPTPAPTDSPAVPAGWQQCVNERYPYGVAYPPGWVTVGLDAETECRWFDPEEFTVEPNTEAPVVAMTVQPFDEPFDTIADRVRDGQGQRVTIREETTVAGQQALRFELVLTEELLYPRGTRIYGYVLDVPDRQGLQTMQVTTTVLPEESEQMDERRQVIDTAARSVTTDVRL